MGRGRSLARGKPKRPELPRVLVYCEGEETEEQYFKGLKAELRGIVNVQIGSTSGEPVGLVRDAVKHRNRAPESSSDRYTAYDEVWCVLDVEAPKPHPGLSQALATARSEGIKVALSNPCFELWLLLHFQFAGGYSTSKQAQKLLEQGDRCGYRADRKHLDYERLRPLHGEACAHAERLRESAPGMDAVSRNPWTDVDLLVGPLLRAKRR